MMRHALDDTLYLNLLVLPRKVDRNTLKPSDVTQVGS